MYFVLSLPIDRDHSIIISVKKYYVIHHHALACALSSAIFFSLEYPPVCVFLPPSLNRIYSIFFRSNLSSAPLSSATFLELLTCILLSFYIYCPRMDALQRHTPDVRFHDHCLSAHVDFFNRIGEIIISNFFFFF